MRRLRLPALALILAVFSAACARGVTLNTDAGQTYAVNVMNEMPHAMVISVDDGATTRTLGTVSANRQDRFVIATSRAGTVTIIATDQGDTHTVRRTVALVAGETVTVRIN
jgi:hypothetical protein